MKTYPYSLLFLVVIACQSIPTPESKFTLSGNFCQPLFLGNPPIGHDPYKNCLTQAYPNLSVVVYESSKKAKIIDKYDFTKNPNFSFTLPKGEYYMDIIVNDIQQPLRPSSSNTNPPTQIQGFPTTITLDKDVTNLKMYYIIALF